MEDLGSVRPFMQILDLPVLQMVARWPSTLSKCPRSLAHRVLLVLVAGGRTVGGSADDHILFLVSVDFGAERRHSSSSSRRANR